MQNSVPINSLSLKIQPFFLKLIAAIVTAPVTAASIATVAAAPIAATPITSIRPAPVTAVVTAPITSIAASIIPAASASRKAYIKTTHKFTPHSINLYYII
jgi:hypothetical protein